MSTIKAININKEAEAIEKLYEYKTIAHMNKQMFTLVKVENRTLDFHTHDDSDEVFFIIDGTMKLEFRDSIVTLNQGDLIVVPKGVEHRPICEKMVTCMLIEAEGTLTPDNSGGTYK